jgi:hypothetical protein
MRAREFIAWRSASVGVGDMPDNTDRERATTRRDQPQQMGRALDNWVGRVAAEQDGSARRRPRRG